MIRQGFGYTEIRQNEVWEVGVSGVWGVGCTGFGVEGVDV